MGKYALVIGNSEYQDPNLAKLKTPDADVNDLAAVLRQPEIGGFDEVTALVNQGSSAVRRAIAYFFRQKKADDLLLLYFSGHGVLDAQGILYLAVKETERDLVSGTAIPAGFITSEMDNSSSRRQVLVLDCCHSGAFARGSKGAVGASVGTKDAFEGTGYGRVVLTATDATQFAWEGDQVIGQAANSLFTHYLIEGLRTGQADVDADGRITVDNLYDYVYGEIVKTTPKQTPGKWSYKQQGDIVVARNPKPVVKAVELPRELRDAMESPLTAVREGVVRELTRLLNGNNAGLALSAYECLKHLGQDDSRKVASAAELALAEYDARQTQLAAQGEAERQAQEKAAQELLARQEAERERLVKEAVQAQLAREKEEEERVARERAAREQAERGRLAREKEEEERVAREKAAQEQAAREQAERDRHAQGQASTAQAPLPYASPTPARQKSTGGTALRRSILTGLAAVMGWVAVIGLCIVGVLFWSRQGAAMTNAAATNASPTEPVRSTVAIQAPATTTGVARETSIAQAAQSTVTALSRKATNVNVPPNGSLVHTSTNGVESRAANADVKDFIVEARFHNPYDRSEGKWDYGFMFRETGFDRQYRLYVMSSRSWQFELWEGSPSAMATLKTASLDNLDISKGGSNYLHLVARDTKLYFFLNGTLIDILDISKTNVSGDIRVATGITAGDKITGKSTDYEGFKIWAIPP